ncbi:unnamed protein product [Miscanthus lutarioriparius]|uniref:Ubiquitin-like protease family profile domain-containing protein n=1 Tax=Miscanthus lutarioriparius TaxID=422564 RepID=A0A811SIV4_9POAL|nr:unnamed protein product [Miscanthus lutarioriparius]
MAVLERGATERWFWSAGLCSRAAAVLERWPSGGAVAFEHERVFWRGASRAAKVAGEDSVAAKHTFAIGDEGEKSSSDDGSIPPPAPFDTNFETMEAEKSVSPSQSEPSPIQPIKNNEIEEGGSKGSENFDGDYRSKDADTSSNTVHDPLANVSADVPDSSQTVKNILESMKAKKSVGPSQSEPSPIQPVKYLENVVGKLSETIGKLSEHNWGNEDDTNVSKTKSVKNIDDDALKSVDHDKDQEDSKGSESNDDDLTNLGNKLADKSVRCNSPEPTSLHSGKVHEPLVSSSYDIFLNHHTILVILFCYYSQSNDDETDEVHSHALAGITIAMSYAETTPIKSVDCLNSKNSESTISVSKKCTHSSLIEKNKRKKSAAKMPDNSITIKAPRFVSTIYNKYIQSDFMEGKDFGESPAFVIISGCTYEALRNSLKPRGRIIDDKKLVQSTQNFDPERVKRELLRINKDYIIVKADLVSNFQRSCQVAEIFVRPLLDYAKKFPQCPQQCNNFDCSLYVMLFVEHFDGRILMKFKSTDVTQFRKVISHRLIYNEKNEVEISKFDA